MEDDQTKAVILQLLLEDLERLEDKQKGKQVAGQHTDLELAVKCMREDIQRTKTSIEDQILALSTSVAVATDQKILATLQQEERIADQDHQFALALHNGTRCATTNDAVVNDKTSQNGSEYAVSMVMGDLMERMTLSDTASNGEGSSRVRPSPTNNLMKECASCLEKFVSTMFKSPCGHEYCRDCTKAMFLGAIKDEELYPPRCCGNIVPPGIALRILSYEELQSFSERALEWTAKDRLYCADPTCSKFIPPFAIKDEHGTCPECHQETHLPCRSLAHPGVDCPLDENLHVVLEIANTESWKRCFNCRTMVELHHGCNHVTCRCGREFCYACGLAWKTCQCPLWHEARLVHMANQVVEEEIRPNVNVEERQEAFNRVVEDLRHHEDVGCQHHRRFQWVWRDHGSLQCEVCHFHLPQYIFVCTGCRMRACYRCRRHRLR